MSVLVPYVTPAWTDMAMVGLTLASIAVAAWAVVVARGSREQAKAAVSAAAAANEHAAQANELASASNGIARDAAKDARAVPVDIAWDELLAAVAALQTLDVASSATPEPFRPLLTAVRTRATLLVDRLEWDDFDGWIAREVRYGIMLMHEAAAAGERSQPLSVDASLELGHRFHLWVAAFTQNLRRFRKTGPQADALSRLTGIVVSETEAVAARNGWPVPPDNIPGVEPLSEDD